MAERVAVLIKLRDGVTKSEVKRLVALIKEIGDHQWTGPAWESHCDYSKKDDRQSPGVYKYDDQYGDPAFYIP